MGARLTPGEWVLAGLLLAIFGYLSSSLLLRVCGGGLVAFGLIWQRTPRS